MKIEDQVCSLELSMRLKELGVKQESLFYYSKNLKYKEEYILISNFKSIYSNIEETDYQISKRVNDEFGDSELFSAFTVAELGQILPSCVNHYWLKIINWNEFYLSYEHDNVHTLGEVQDENEACARAKMLIYLIENKLIVSDEQ